jgi:hypothetical protein
MSKSKIVPLSETCFQVRHAEQKWYSRMFNDVDEAIAFRATFNFAEAAKSAKQEMVGPLVRLTGSGWSTEFMTPSDLGRLLEDGGFLSAPQPRPKRGRPKSVKSQE